MIQRPQTLYFLAVVAISMMLIFSNIVFFKAENAESTQIVEVEYDETKIMSTDVSSKQTNTYLIAIAAAIATLSLVALFLYKNRKLQTKVSAINYLFILGYLVMMYMYSMKINYLEGNGSQEFTFAVLLPQALLFFNYLALRGIKKDEALIRSMDRLR